MSTRKTIGAGWKKQTDKGAYVALSFNGSEIAELDLSNCWVSLIKNDRKQKPTHPDYNITATPKADAPQKQKPAPPEDDFGF